MPHRDPQHRARWRSWEDIADIFSGPEDSDWRYDVDLVNGSLAEMRTPADSPPPDPDCA